MTRMRAFVIVILLLSVSLFSYAAAKSGSEYTIIDTGIKAGGCWYDDTHFVVVKGHQPAPGQEFEVEGLYYLDPSMPKNLKRIDLSPIDLSLQKHIRDVSCQEQTILFHVLNAGRKRNQLYTLKLGQPPAVLAEKTEGFVVPQSVNVRGQYVLDVTSVLQARDLQNSALPEQANEDCRFAYLRDNYRVVCLRHDRGTKQRWLLNDVFLARYVWDPTIRVDKDGAYQWVPNPEPPLKLPDGTELKQGYLLRDLENRIVQEIPTKQGIYRIDEMKPALNGTYLYAICSKAGDYNPPMTFYGRICRFRLAGISGKWEEVFSLQKKPNEWASLDALDVNDRGDVVVRRRANHASPTLSKYTARHASVEQLPTPKLSQEVGAVQLAPDGQTISYVDKGLLVFVQSQGGKP